ncbi:MAG: ketopantoate reductase family protein [Candidatus Promineifilaceae bacterium]
MTTKNSDHMPPVTIIGSGALGSLFAAFLEPHCDVSMLSHWPEQIEAIRSDGLACQDTDGQRTRHDIAVTNDVRELAPVRLALVLVKSYQTARAAFELAPVLAADGVAITLQNGLGNYEILEKALGYGHVAQGVTAQGATMLGPGHVHHAGHGLTNIAGLAGKNRLLGDFIDLLNRAGLKAALASDVTSLQWGKLAVNAGINPLTAILGVRNGYLLENEPARSVMCAAALEVEKVARTMGISLPYDDVITWVLEVAQATADNVSSMLQDVLRGAQTEIDAINGAVASYGKRSGVPTPVNLALWRAVKNLGGRSADDDTDRLLSELLDVIDAA